MKIILASTAIAVATTLLASVPSRAQEPSVSVTGDNNEIIAQVPPYCIGVSEAECRKRVVHLIIEPTFRQDTDVQVSVTGDNNEIIAFDSAKLFGQPQNRAAAKDILRANGLEERLCSRGFQKMIIGPSASRPTYGDEFDLNCSGAPSLKPPSKDIQSASSLSKSAENGNAAAQAKLGLAYITGSDEPKDYAHALFWLNKAAQQGNASGEANLGYMFLNGWGVAQDYAQALLWLTKSAAQGDALGENNLAAMYEHGWGVAKNDVEAVMWYRKAAEQGLAEAQDNLGHMYRYGIGVMEDNAKAVEWYRKAAEQGFAQGENDLGAMYANGFGVPEDDVEATKWLKKAADQGDSEAQENLKVLQSLTDSLKQLESPTAPKTGAPNTGTNSEALPELRAPPPVDSAMPKPRLPVTSSKSAEAQSEQSGTTPASAPRGVRAAIPARNSKAGLPTQSATVLPASTLKDADMTFFGLHLGEKFPVPECMRKATEWYSVETKGYDVSNESLCFRWADGYDLFNDPARVIPVNTPVVTDRVVLVFPLNLRPMYTANAYMQCLVVDGKLARVILPTGGLEWQDYWLAQLKQKYGPPATLKEISKQNGFGAIFNSHEAIWRFANLHIDFDGTLDSLDEGAVDIVTNEGAEFEGGTRNVDHPAPPMLRGPKM